MKRNIKIIITILLILFIIISSFLLLKLRNDGKTYKEITVEEFKNIANENGYYILDKSYYENLEEYEPLEGVSDYAVGFFTDQDGALQYKIYFYEFDSQEELDRYYKDSIEYIKEWNDEEKSIKKEIGSNYKKCEITNKYGYGIVINVGNTLFTSYGYKDELNKIINALYE